MSEPSHTLEEIKALFQKDTIEMESIQSSIVALCDHLIAQKAEIDRVRGTVMTPGQVVAAAHGSPF